MTGPRRRWAVAAVLVSLTASTACVSQREAYPVALARHPATLSPSLDSLVIAAPQAPTPTAAIPLPAPPEPPSRAGDVAIAAPPERFEGPPAPKAPPPPALRSTQFEGVVPASGTWAVMIGINDYPGTRNDLNSAVNDAHDVNEALARMGVPGNQRLLIRDGQATAGVVLAAADWLVAHASQDAVVVFFYGGHVRKVEGSTEAIIAADGRTVTDAELAARLAPLRARQSWIAIAACFGGGFTEVLAPGRVLTGAAPANSLAYENSDFNRSYMVEYMVRRAMIEGHAPATVQQAFAYARDALVRDGYETRQPVQFDNSAGPLDLRQKKPAPAGAPPPKNTPAGSAGTTTTTVPPREMRCNELGFGVTTCS